MAKRVSVDRWMFTVTTTLVFIGLVMIFSASAVMAKERYGSAYEFLLKQLVWAVAGLVVMVLAMKVDYKRLQHPALVFLLLGFTTLLLISVFFLDRAAIVPTSVFLGLIVFQPDLGTAIACAGITACVLFVAGIRLRYFGYAFAVSLLPLYFLIFHVSYRKDRILAFLNPYADPKGFGFHIIQSLIAVSTGGVTGLGLMEGKQKLFYLPEPHTDFIFAVTAEELGLVGALAVIILFAIFLWRGTRAALRTQDNFGRFLAVGITSMIVLQAFINISVVLGLMPTKGIPLPFVSYGGSSLFVTLMCVGVLLNITKQAE